MMLTLASLGAAVPRANAHAWLDPLNDAAAEFGIDTASNLAAFLGQCGHESADFTQLTENLNYSAQGLANTWPNRFSSGTLGGARVPNALAMRIERQPEAIANQAYSSRMGNGDVASGDGWAFIGRGIIQITGRDNYTRAEQALGIDLVRTPANAALPIHAARIAAWWWVTHGASHHGDAADWLTVSRIVNLGNARSSAMPNGWADRKARSDLAMVALTSAQA
jgi:putative chitinase